MDTLSPRQFKSLYTNPDIKSVKLFQRYTPPHVPVTYAKIVDQFDNTEVYCYNPDGYWFHCKEEIALDYTQSFRRQIS